MAVSRNLVTMFCLSAFLLLGVGCGRSDQPDLGYVSGSVTIDSAPVVGIQVVFQPESGRPAVGLTDDKGNYEVEYTYQTKGTKVGPSSVSLLWPQGATPTAAIPKEYGDGSIKVDIKAGQNTFDYPLKSEGAAPVKKPAAAPID